MIDVKYHTCKIRTLILGNKKIGSEPINATQKGNLGQKVKEC